MDKHTHTHIHKHTHLKKKYLGCLLSSLLIRIVLEVLVRAIRQEKNIKFKQFGEKVTKVFLFSNNVINHIVLTKGSTGSYKTNK